MEREKDIIKKEEGKEEKEEGRKGAWEKEGETVNAAGERGDEGRGEER